MKNIMFFDLNLVGIARYPLQIAHMINTKEDNITFYFLYEEDPSNQYAEIKQLLPSNSKLIKIKNVDYKYIKDLMQKINPHSLLVMAQRIPDNALIAIAHELKISTFKFQHGLYIPFMKKDLKIILYKITKLLRYFQYAIVVAKATKKSKLLILKEYISIFLRGKNICSTKLPLPLINAHTAFVYGQYWKEYHLNEFGYAYNQQIIVGYPDLMQLNEIQKEEQEDAICYICQTLVEDDRLPREEMLKFIHLLKNSIGKQTLYLKLHPRSDLSLYKVFENSTNIKMVKKFPNCKKYIGHYSSVLALSMYLTERIFLWKFNNHNEYPFYLVENAEILSDSEKELKIFLEDEKIQITQQHDIQNYFYYDGIDPILKISKELLNE